MKKPRIEIRAKHIPAPLVRFLKDTYKPENVAVCKNEDSIPFEESDWFKNLDSTPGEMIVANRDLRNGSQSSAKSSEWIPQPSLILANAPSLKGICERKYTLP